MNAMYNAIFTEQFPSCIAPLDYSHCRSKVWSQ